MQPSEAKRQKSTDVYEEKLDILESNQSMLCDDIERMLSVNERLKRENAQLKQEMTSLAQISLTTHTLLSQEHLSLLKLEERLAQLEISSHNGQLVWKIDDVANKLSANSVLLSPSFYTSVSGYRCLAKLYLTGDGVAKGTHVSLFLVLQRGEFDAVLAWPFRQKVTFTLMDQEDAGRSYQDAFTPDPTCASSFGRPQRETNVPAGIIKFFPLDKLARYVKDDTLFVKVVVQAVTLLDSDRKF